MPSCFNEILQSVNICVSVENALSTVEFDPDIQNSNFPSKVNWGYSSDLFVIIIFQMFLTEKFE